MFEESELPKAIVSRIVKNALPVGASLQKEARLAVNRAGTEFVNHLASLLNQIAKESNDKTITTAHVLRALELADFQQLIDPITEALEVHREIITEKKQKLKERRKAVINSDEPHSPKEILEETIETTPSPKDQSLDIV
ncbi:unnamed protein product [Rhizopus stolonifer]